MRLEAEPQLQLNVRLRFVPEGAGVALNNRPTGIPLRNAQTARLR
jgi:hypothetical protein